VGRTAPPERIIPLIAVGLAESRLPVLSQKRLSQFAFEKLQDECSEPKNNGTCKEAKHEKRNYFLAVHTWEIAESLLFVSAQMHNNARAILPVFLGYWPVRRFHSRNCAYNV
jgi:hypothetical protein